MEQPNTLEFIQNSLIGELLEYKADKFNINHLYVIVDVKMNVYQHDEPYMIFGYDLGTNEIRNVSSFSLTKILDLCECKQALIQWNFLIHKFTIIS